MNEAGGARERRSAAIWVAAYVGFQWLGRHVRLPHDTPPWLVFAVVIVSLVGFMLLTLAMTAALTRILIEPRPALLAIGVGLVVWLAVAAYLGSGPAAARGKAPRPSEARLLLAQVVDLSRAVAAVGIGALVASLIRDRNILLPGALFAAFADFFVVNYGTVHVALQSEQGRKIVSAMSSQTPAVKVGNIPLPTLTVGMADIVFIAFFVACVLRFGMNLRGTLAAFAVLLPAGLLFVAITGLPVPALVPMALGFVAVNFRYFRLSRSELRAVGVVFAVVALMTAAFFVFKLGR